MQVSSWYILANVDPRGWASGWTPSQNNQSNYYLTCEDWSSPTAAYTNVDNPEDAYATEPAGNISASPWVSGQNDQHNYCTHPCGHQSCVHHSQGATDPQTTSQSFAYAALDVVSPAHLDFGIQAPISFDAGCGQSGSGNAQLLSAADRDERGRPRSAPPSVELYLRDRQSHEELACGLSISNTEQSKTWHKRKITLTISNKDLKIQDRRS
ncbi:hypothetical protein PG996_009632 [Apiospora saccharicola]|uniref:Uncharacterized protein n=1 Tax=Apiospora saccharicola TaxID=335842 RepID=A0ABR1ULC1_9PEZI